MIELMNCAEHLNAARQLAAKHGLSANLEELINRLEHWGEDRDTAGSFVPAKSRCLMYKDFAPYSFVFTMQARGEDGKYRDTFTGGLIYHPAPGTPDSSLSVQLQPFHCWQIHT